MWGMITALVSGALMSIQGVFNSAVMKHVGIGWLGADKCVCGLPADVAFYGARRGIGALADRTAVYADRRCDRGIYHVHGHQEL